MGEFQIPAEVSAMPSPFPGMNPYIERASVWHGFHERWIPLVADLISAQVLPRYFVDIGEHKCIHDLSAEVREVGMPSVDCESQSFLEIRDHNNNELVTVLELLSPANKYAGPDREQY